MPASYEFAVARLFETRLGCTVADIFLDVRNFLLILSKTRFSVQSLVNTLPTFPVLCFEVPSILNDRLLTSTVRFAVLRHA